jgi:benzodiazapine receptor
VVFSWRQEHTDTVPRSRLVTELTAAAGPPLAAAVLGNAFVGREALRWFGQLHKPRMQLPLPAFLATGAVYYLQLGWVLHRARLHDDRAVRNRALLVLAGNELWNAAFFGRRSPRAGFLGVLVFLGPLLALQKSVTADPPSLIALTPYTLWVVIYDIPWTYQLWRLNPSPSANST